MICAVMLVLSIATLPFVLIASPIYAVPKIEGASHWNNLAQEALREQLSRELNTNVAKNVILFIGDGWGISTITAARILKGQIDGNSGEETVMEYEKFPHSCMLKTYDTKLMTPDSCSSATALLTGIKTRTWAVGVDSEIELNKCSSVKEHQVNSILDWSLAAGKSVGIVTTSTVTDCTPACAYAHTASRFLVTDRLINQTYIDHNKGCRDITYQLVADNPNIQVIMGGGRSTFTAVKPGATDRERMLSRSDGLDLIQMWRAEKEWRGVEAKYVTNTEELRAVDVTKTDYLLGLFHQSYMSFDIDRSTAADGEPSLAEMTEKAVQILSRNPKGYFLMVEGGRVDHAHHNNMAKRALYDSLAFEKAVKRAKQMTNQEDSLIVVTADHSHTMAIGGYTIRGNDILGKMRYNEINNYSRALDNKPVTVLLYGNGVTHNISGPRPNISDIDTTDDDYQYQAAVPTFLETHSGEDVAAFADGPMAHLFSGVHEQNYIAHALAYASCVGKNLKHCDVANKLKNEHNPWRAGTKS